MNKPQFIILHHSAGPDNEGSDFEAVRTFHVKQRGWSDIGYHRFIERDGGTVVAKQGRPYEQSGAHCPGMNSRSIGVCVNGNFDKQHMDETTRLVLVGEIARLMLDFAIPYHRVMMHRQAAQPGRGTACPGKYFPYELIMKEVREFEPCKEKGLC